MIKHISIIVFKLIYNFVQTKICTLSKHKSIADSITPKVTISDIESMLKKNLQRDERVVVGAK